MPRCCRPATRWPSNANRWSAKCLRVQELGFRAAKIEVCINGPYSHNGLQADDADGVEIVAACREAVGPDFTLMVDVAYAWPSAKHALGGARAAGAVRPVLRRNADRHRRPRRLRRVCTSIRRFRIAAGEWQNTHWEFLDLADRGKLDVLQPDVGRVGGFTEARKVCQIAEQRGRQIVPHCWKSAIGIAASAHLAASTPVCRIHRVPAGRTVRIAAAPRIGRRRSSNWKTDYLKLPTRPGLGIELNREALERFAEKS